MTTWQLKTWDLSNEKDRKALFDHLDRTPGKNQLEAIPLAQDTDAPLFAALGLPTPELIFSSIWHGSRWGQQYKNFLVEMVGVEERQLKPGDPRSGASIEYENNAAGVKYNIDLWRRRVIDRNSRIMIREIFNPLTDRKAPLSLALGNIGWVTNISYINPGMPDVDKEILDTQNVALGLMILREASGKLEEKRAWMIAAVESYVRDQTHNSRRPGKWKFTHFAKHWIWGKIRPQNLYKELPKPLREEAEALYKKRCAEIIRARNEGKNV